ncbi:hypothetical protein CLV51_11013 [Chitinophaga niastensis]|uniref:Uncharacterized protein n=1 Tax=Chitinophaga niastensis TaxID=536980 RepID=A0A2P8H987_CHINA|nr:hypothetical protein [Chitinophaga niastensis]PSL42797.1 hypothetical protein CLV51_11013 [Chitinophaga niastensis]
MNYHIEKYYPIYLSSAIAAILFLGHNHVAKIDQLTDKVCENALSLSVTLVGFFLTILTLLNSIESRRMQFVKDAGMMPRVLEYLRKAINYNIGLIAFSFIVKFIEHRTPWYFYVNEVNIIDLLYLYLFSYTVLLSFRFTQIFVSLLTDPKNNS